MKWIWKVCSRKKLCKNRIESQIMAIFFGFQPYFGQKRGMPGGGGQRHHIDSHDPMKMDMENMQQKKVMQK